jgi:hypothetical protein
MAIYSPENHYRHYDYDILKPRKKKKGFWWNHTWIAHATVSLLPTELQQITY